MIKLKKNGFYDGDEIIKDLSLYLSSAIIEMEEGVTLGNLFDILIKFNDLDLLFKTWTRGFKFKSYYDDLKKPLNLNKEEEDIDFLSIHFSHVPEIFEWEDDDCVLQSEFTDYVSVSAKTIENSERYSIGLMDLNKFIDCFIILDKKYEIMKSYTESLLLSTKEFTLNEMVGSLLNEISFYGYSKDKQNVIEDLDSISNRIDSGEEEMTPMEDMMIKILEKKLKYLVENEKYEKAEKVKKEILKYKEEKPS